MKVGDRVVDNTGVQGVILKVEREEKKLPCPGRYTVQFDDGTIIENFPGYLLELA